MDKRDERTEISKYGEFGIIDHLTDKIRAKNISTIKGIGDDAAVIQAGADEYTLISSDLLLEGINFDLTYFPLQHLGYKAVVIGINDILAMNGMPTQLTVSLGISSKISVEQLEALYSGINSACDEYGVDLVGGDTAPSVTGMVIAVSAIGKVGKSDVVYRSGAGQNDLICITGDLGAAYMGLHLLEREKRAFAGNDTPQPKFEGYEYLLSRQLKPHARMDIINSMKEVGITPTSMIDLSDGLASDILQICKSSGCGARIYLDRIPIAKETHEMARELNADPVVAALNGGDDHELLFTVPVMERDKIIKIGGVEVIGHITAQNTGAYLVTPDGSDIAIKAQGFGQP